MITPRLILICFLFICISCSRNEICLLPFLEEFPWEISEHDFCNKYHEYPIERLDLHQYKIGRFKMGKYSFVAFINFEAVDGTRIFCQPVPPVPYESAIVDELDKVIYSACGKPINSAPVSTAVFGDGLITIGMVDGISKEWNQSSHIERVVANFNGQLVYYLTANKLHVDFRKGAWGESKSVIELRERNTLKKHETNECRIFGFDVSTTDGDIGVLYFFDDNNRLYKGEIIRFCVSDDCIEDFIRHEDRLKKDYQLQDSRFEYSNSVSSTMRESLGDGELVKRGLLTITDYFTQTDLAVFDDTVVYLKLEGNNGIITLTTVFWNFQELKKYL